MNIDFYNYSGRGGRPVNEDSFACGEGYYVVSDGLGGHDNGEVASSAAVRYISENYRSDISPEAAGGLLAGADDAVRRFGDGGKATVAAVFTNGDKIRISNVGDSRVYYFRRGSIFFRTKDHSVCQASVDMGEMTDDDVRRSADRSGLLKVLGDSAPLKLPKPYELIDPQDGDAFLICSDGFWEHVYDIEMEADLLKAGNAREWLEHMLKRLLLRSGNSGDNFTAVCGIIHAPDKLPRTTALLEDVSVDIPTTMELSDTSAAFGGRKKLIIGAATVAAAAAIGVIAAVLIYNGVKPDGNAGGSPAAGDSSFDMSSSIIGPESSDNPDSPSEPDTPSEPDLPSDSDSPSESDSPSNPDSSSEPDLSSEPNSSDDPDEPGLTSRPELPELPVFPVFSASSGSPGFSGLTPMTYGFYN
ncbi:MAG: protein phosphatase 2C domain-containing protein [Oscillospiraceae bacterium]|nr:protein phosphatase 2C domain-containing protein [Oscillospiraceae bacterium]